MQGANKQILFDLTTRERERKCLLTGLNNDFQKRFKTMCFIMFMYRISSFSRPGHLPKSFWVGAYYNFNYI